MPAASLEQTKFRHSVRALLLVAAVAVACSPTFLGFYIQQTGGYERLAPAPVFHVVVIMLAIGLSAFATYVAYRAYQVSGKPFQKWLLLGMVSFTVIYSPHGFLTTIALDLGNPWLFLLFGPASRLFLAVCFLLASLSYSQEPAPPVRSHAALVVGQWMVLCLAACACVAVVALSPIAHERNLRWAMEFGSMGLLALSIAALWFRGGRGGFSQTFMVVQLLFIQSSLAFLFAPMWSHSWWFAHIIYAGGFLLLTYQVAAMYFGGVAFEEVFSTTELLENLRHANQRYERSNRDLSMFAHTVSHDLQAPLRRMNNFVDLAEEGIKGTPVPEEVHYYMQVIRDSSTQLRALVTRILELSSVGSKKLEITDIDMNKLMQDIKALFQSELDRTGASWKVDEQLPMIRGDRILLFQVFQNLIQNAIKYRSPERSLAIAISARQDGKDWVFDVADNGRGFDMSEAKKAFQMLYRLHAADTSGTGAGLAICTRIIDRHGGKIDVDAKTNEGATFHVRLPIH